MRDDALNLQSARVIKCGTLRVTAAMVSALEKEVKCSPLGPGGRHECTRAELGARSISTGRGRAGWGTEKESRRVLRKIDRHILPLMCCAYDNFSWLDKC